MQETIEYFWTEDTLEACCARRLLYDGEFFNPTVDIKRWHPYQHTDQLGWEYRFPKTERNMNIMKPKIDDVVLYRFENDGPFTDVGFIKAVYDNGIKVQISSFMGDIENYADVYDVNINDIKIIRRYDKHFPSLTIKRYKE